MASDINILLLGETGVGKSTFINSFANYMTYDSFEAAAESENLTYFIPAEFAISDKDFKQKVVTIGSDENENMVIGNSSTQGAKSYVFPVGDRQVRLIDTPGIGDSRGVIQDDLNLENVLEYISRFDYLHGICFLLKPNVSTITAYFKFCLLHLLSRLERSAVDNIVFLFTNSRGTFFKPTETLTILKRILKEVEENPPYVKIPCGKSNMFSMDNEAFRFLVALKNDLEFTDEEKHFYSMSWNVSAAACKQLLDYISGEDGLQPHLVENTLSVNEARRIISDLAKPLVDISDLIRANVTVLQQRLKEIEEDNQSIEDFRKKLYIPVVNIVKETLEYPVTICTSSKCTEIISISDDNVMYNYTQKCHIRCYLDHIPREHIGAPDLLYCAAMGGTQSCIECGCPFSTHMHIYYEAKKVNTEGENTSVKFKIDSLEDQIKAQEKMVEELQIKRQEFENERDVITKALAKFALFRKNNSISTYNDVYETYLDYLISREKTHAIKPSQTFIDQHVALKERYQEEKRILEGVQSSSEEVSEITPSDVTDLINQLYNLKHTGEKIKDLHLTQHSMISKEHKENDQYQH